MRVAALIAVTAALALPAYATAEPRAPHYPTAASIASTITATWRCQDQLGVERSKVGQSPWSLPRSVYRAWVANLWKIRHDGCHDRLQEVKRQWNWQAWLPDNWRRLAICEQSLNWFAGWPHPIHTTDGSFVSAFSISTSEYDANARLMGVRAWDNGSGKPPTPWEQYQAALGHYKRFGDGWGCPGP